MNFGKNHLILTHDMAIAGARNFGESLTPHAESSSKLGAK